MHCATLAFFLVLLPVFVSIPRMIMSHVLPKPYRLGSREICPEPQCNPKLQRRSPEPQSGLEDQAPEVRA